MPLPVVVGGIGYLGLAIAAGFVAGFTLAMLAILTGAFVPSEWIFSQMMIVFPGWDDSLEQIELMFNYVNPWVDVEFLIRLLNAYLLFLVALVTYRIVKSWIPLVSGS